eukprot:gb/GFBE01056980.1/.p1 GENE.gb/GFBE01056980.1/~~gb/GFBE01056980.1/.p1  ORF type:complete len:218 (+),score=51.39 gb/GFBE01056980.1/:1-654(+)
MAHTGSRRVGRGLLLVALAAGALWSCTSFLLAGPARQHVASGRLLTRLYAEPSGDEKRLILSEDLEIGKEYPAKVLKLGRYGADLDIGADKGAFLHVRNAANEKTADVSDIMKIGDTINVKILRVKDKEVEVAIRDLPEFTMRPLSDFKEGDELTGTVVSSTNRASFIDIGAMVQGYLSINNANSGESGWRDMFKPGNEVKVKIQRVTNSRITLTQL